MSIEIPFRKVWDSILIFKIDLELVGIWDKILCQLMIGMGSRQSTKSLLAITGSGIILLHPAFSDFLLSYIIRNTCDCTAHVSLIVQLRLHNWWKPLETGNLSHLQLMFQKETPRLRHVTFGCFFFKAYFFFLIYSFYYHFKFVRKYLFYQ